MNYEKIVRFVNLADVALFFVLSLDVMGRVLKEKSPSGKEVQYQWGGEGCASCGAGSKLTKITDTAGFTAKKRSRMRL